MKSLNGKELQDFIKVRQLRQVRNLRQQHGIVPKLVIFMSDKATEASEVYVRMKKSYAADIEVDVEIVKCAESELKQRIDRENSNDLSQGIIVQLPLMSTDTDEIVGAISPQKDIDGLGDKADYVSATAGAIDWLLTGYDVELRDKKIAILGNGRLVGAPLAKLWQERGLDVTTLDEFSDSPEEVLINSEIIVTAAGVPGLLKSQSVSPGAVVVDAGTANENGVIKGDSEPALRRRSDIIITPEKGGVGPLTIAVLFDHLIEACLKKADLL